MDRQAKQFIAAHGLTGIIRISQEEYAAIQGAVFTHFNLEQTTIAVGGRYALPRILRHGFITVLGREIFPTLSFDAIYIGECLEVRNHIAYEALTPADFEHSMTHIQTADDLKRAISKRYASSTSLNESDILSRGVSRAVLRLSKLHEVL